MLDEKLAGGRKSVDGDGQPNLGSCFRPGFRSFFGRLRLLSICLMRIGSLKLGPFAWGDRARGTGTFFV
jgi:hypothetical protein